MKATIANFRQGRHHQNTKQMILVIDGVENKENATSLIGKEVVWTSPAGKELKGKISAPHGSKGAVRAIFETGMPGQSIGKEIDVQ